MLKSRDPNCDRAQASHETRFHRGPAFVNGALLLLSALCVVSSLAAVNWPELRGPLRNGHALDANPPLSWSETNRIVWKSAIHDLGWSSPVVWGEQIWLTTATTDGREMYAVCVDAQTGRVVMDVKVFDTP